MVKDSTTRGKECPYENDWPWRLIVPIARLVEGPIRKPRSFFSSSEPHPLTIGLVLLFAYGGVGSVAAAIQGILLTIKTVEDYFTILAAILLPLGGVIAFSFYRRVFATFDKLHSDGVLIEVEPPAVSKFKYRLNRGFNALPPQPVFVALVLFGLHDWPKSMLEGRLQGSLAALHPAVQLWHMSVAFLAMFSLVFFAWKCLVLWLAMRRLGHASAGLKLTVRESHHDGCGGLSPITSCWLHVHYMIVIVGVYVFGSAVLLNHWTNPAFLLAAVMYAFLAPTLLVGPFFSIHRGTCRSPGPWRPPACNQGAS